MSGVTWHDSASGAGGYYYTVDLPDGRTVGGFADTKADAEFMIQLYQEAETRPLVYKGPRSPWGQGGIP